ncbi:hypothetical protein D3C87_1185410 [compost metagenome]
MNFHTLKCWGKRSLALVALLSSAHAMAATDRADRQADVQLKTDVTLMNIQVSQGAPLPPGGCVGGYSWHTTYGGCRRAESQPDSGTCPPGYTGSRTRYRTAHILQANSYDVAYEAWGPWQESCTAPRASGVMDTVIAAARGAESGATGVGSGMPPGIERAMQVNYGTLYGITIYRPTAQLNCLFASGTTSGSGESTGRIWSGFVASPGTSVSSTGNEGFCSLSNGNLTATVYGSCDSSSGGDGDFCLGATRVVNITSVSGCVVSTETVNTANGQLVDRGSYDICH